MKRIAILSLLALCTMLLPSAGYAQGTDLTSAAAVYAYIATEQDSPNYDPSFCPTCPYEPEQQITDPGGCWFYGSDSNYTWSDLCVYSTNNNCRNACLDQEQACVSACKTKCGNTNNANGSCFETCGDNCRSQYNTCSNRCS